MRRSLLLVVAVAACGPNPKAPVAVMALVYNSAGQLGPRQTTLETVSSVTGCTGSAASFVGGGSIVLDPTDPMQQDISGLSDDQLMDALVRDRGGAVAANLIDKGGVLWPADFHSWNMISAYWNFEQAFAYFTRAYDGDSTDDLASPTVFYWGNYQNLAISDPAQQTVFDNAFYYAPVRTFVLTPFDDKLQKVPLAMNTGVIGHEFAHRVFNQKAYGNQAVPQELAWQGAPLNILKGLDEGLADFHGYGVTCRAKDGPGCDSEFLLPSFDEKLAVARDFARDKENCMSEELRTAIANLPSDSFLNQGLEYQLGTLFASSLYWAANNGGKLDAMEKALVRAYDDSTHTSTPGLRQVFQTNLATPENITLEKLSDVILSHLTDVKLAEATCTELVDRLKLDRVLLPHCPATATMGAKCPALP